MSKKLDEIRKNIVHRKNMKTGTKISINHSPLLSDDERYGNQPSGLPNSNEPGTIHLKSTWFPKFLLSVFIFFLTFLVYNSELPMIKKSKETIHYALTEDLPFATMHSWYESHFGGTFVSLGFDQAEPNELSGNVLSIPVSGLDEERITSTGEGIHIEVSAEESVYSLEKGTVLFAGNKPDTGRTIILQHDDGRKSIYGQLDEIDVFHYQTIPANQPIGTVRPDELGTSALYFAIQDGSEYLNPLQEILGDKNEY
uniref:M23 family metallopeptidase n=1 Tax=uncultured Allobacillus sp. TaxID=1638025 RepID=UPI002597F33D|nr:M23 family metallopeptidase [uncultured Allobacillus sp.]